MKMGMLWETQSRVVAVDVETTGLSARQGGRVIEIGLVAVEDGCLAAEFDTLIDCGAPISLAAFRVHGISEDMLAGQPKPAEVWPQVMDFMGNSPLIAHNAPFDSSCVRRELAFLGLSLPNPWHCTVRLSRKVLPKLENHRLDTVYRHLFGDLPCTVQRHRALDDARLAARVWMELMGRVNEKYVNG